MINISLKYIFKTKKKELSSVPDLIKNKEFEEDIPKDMDIEFKEVYFKCKDYTMTSIERMYALYKATKYVIEHGIKGDFVECGVWKGGSSMVIALTLLQMKDTSRRIYLYDTYMGMTKPTEKDRYISNQMLAINDWKNNNTLTHNNWACCSLEEVQKNMYSTKYPPEKIIFIKGKVEETIPKNMPENISLLRLDTDWYESTYHEMLHLFPLISSKGIIIIDDYGWFTGAKEAVDTYFKQNNISILFNRIDITGRLGIKN